MDILSINVYVPLHTTNIFLDNLLNILVCTYVQRIGISQQILLQLLISDLYKLQLLI